MSIQNWEHFFKPEVRSSGRKLFSQGKVSISQPSDTELVIYIKASTSFNVSFKTESVESSRFWVNCNCPASKKGQYCKHIWAGLLAAQIKNPDFFESKSEIEKQASTFKTSEKPKSSPQSEAREAAQAAYKAKQADYRKEQYQKQKQRLKDFKSRLKNKPEISEFPVKVEKALSFFSENGFELKESLNKESIGAAKKKLARIFHPDLGGSHEEILELNRCVEILIKFVEQNKKTYL